ncbi:NAD(P)-binding domain-containing protein [Alkalihalobacillus oceani]|uniref:NAD(P)-binding domain-containing protein n=1 Tax=Halalkalibacter oceani TaxID=1653776 RepID=A0A9X2DLQ9_9BACI|nr:NAD(P)-dependent oxidoreductase [Halalkalibacter oceani]MCM3712578.1 NAD(P)-binding domain-containing protein [Halalkalibacter oceani]
MNIVYVDPVSPELKQLLLEMKPPGAELSFSAELDSDRRETAFAQADYLVVATAEISASLLERTPRLVHIQKTGVGVDNIDLQAAKERNITVANTPGANANGVAELSMLMILALYRRLLLLDRETKQGEWPMWKHRLSSYEVSGKVHGLFGFGRIGQETARRSKAFGTTIIYYDVQRASREQEEALGAVYVAKEELLRQADIISLHLPLLPETRHFLDKAEFELMKHTAVLINVSRGGTVNEEALAAALQAGQISGAGIDVWSSEPPERNHPLFALDQVIATPHIGAGTKDTLKRVLEIAFSNIEKIEAGNQASNLVSI